MNESEYLSNRVQDQIDWYGSKSQWNQKWFKRLKIVEISCAAAIPFLAGGISSGSMWIKISIGALGAFIAISNGIQSLFKLQENWILYRSTSESLKHEKYLYSTKTAPYDQDQAFNAFVQRVEGLISKENTSWSQNSSQHKEQHPKTA